MANKSAEEIALLAEGGKRLSSVLTQVAGAVKPGVSTRELDEMAERLIKDGGDTPAFLGYKPDFSGIPFPGSLCTSVNDEVVHGIPGDRVLNEGDIISLDIGLVHEGLITDMAVTIPVGEISEPDQKLLTVTKKALARAIKTVKAGVHIGDIGAAIEDVVQDYANKDNAEYGIVRELGGHGVGHAVHEPPYIPHFGKKGTGPKLEEGMVIAIEPMINLGGPEVDFHDDGYTVATHSGNRSAHFELTMAVTRDGARILTPQPEV